MDKDMEEIIDQEDTGTQRLNNVLTNHGLEVVGNFPQIENNKRVSNTDFTSEDMGIVHKLARKIKKLGPKAYNWTVEIMPRGEGSDLTYRLSGRNKPLAFGPFNDALDFSTNSIDNYLKHPERTTVVPPNSGLDTHSNYEDVTRILKRQGFGNISPEYKNDTISITFTAKNDLILQKLTHGISTVHYDFDTKWSLFVEGKTNDSYLFKLEAKSKDVTDSMIELESNLTKNYSGRKKNFMKQQFTGKPDLRSNGEHKTYVVNNVGTLPRNGHIVR